MTFRITVALRLSGQIDADALDAVSSQLLSHAAGAIDLDDVTLVDLTAVRFLVAREAEGIQLVRCPGYIREWMDRERQPWS